MKQDGPNSVRSMDFMMKEIDVRGALTGGIAHDMNNKLAAIIGTIDVLLTQVDSESGIGDGLRDVLGAALEMQELVRQIPSCRPA